MKYPEKNIQLMVTDPDQQLLVIRKFREEEINVYKLTNEFDKNYPYLFWHGDYGELTQTSDNNPKSSGRIVCNSIEEFFRYFNLTSYYEIY